MTLKRNKDNPCVAKIELRIAALLLLSLFLPWLLPFVSCGSSATTSHDYCSDYTSSVLLVTDVAELTLIDDNDTAIVVSANILTVTHGENVAAEDGDVTITLAWEEDGETSTLTVADCYALDDSCFTFSPGTLIGAQVRSGVANDDDSVSYPVTVTYDTTGGASRRLAATITTDAEEVTVDRNNYSCVEDCTNNTFGLAECGDDTNCDYTCDNGATGSYSYSPGCEGLVEGGELSDGSDCTVQDLVFPELPEAFTAEFAE